MMLLIYTDGACSGNPGPMGLGIVVKGEKKKSYSLYAGVGTNNRAEYLAVLEALKIAKKMKEKEVVIRSDSKLVMEQLRGNYKVKNKELKELKKKIEEISKNMKVRYEWVAREKNPADRLAKKAISNENKI